MQKRAAVAGTYHIRGASGLYELSPCFIGKTKDTCRYSAFTYGICFDYHTVYGLSIVLKNRYIEQMADRYQFCDSQTHRAVQAARNHALHYMQDRINRES